MLRAANTYAFSFPPPPSGPADRFRYRDGALQIPDAAGLHLTLKGMK